MLLPIGQERAWLLAVLPFYFFPSLNPLYRGSIFSTFCFPSSPPSRTLPGSNHSRPCTFPASKCNLTPVTRGSQCTFSRNPVFPMPSFLTCVEAQNKLWHAAWSFCTETRARGWSHSSNELFTTCSSSSPPAPGALVQSGILATSESYQAYTLVYSILTTL